MRGADANKSTVSFGWERASQLSTSDPALVSREFSLDNSHTPGGNRDSSVLSDRAARVAGDGETIEDELH